MTSEDGFHAQRTSILSLISLLNEIKSNPKIYKMLPNFDFHLRSQGNLCRMSIPEKSIIPSSLNTFKRYCAKVAPGGFEAVDKLRSTVYLLITREIKKTTEKPRTTQKQAINRLQRDCARLNIDLLRLTKILKISMAQTAYYANIHKDPTLTALFHKERRELIDMLTTVSYNDNDIAP
ncbi:hypothetical protein D3C84_330170 [compost metagenome]